MSDPTPPAREPLPRVEEPVDDGPSGEELPPLPDGGLSRSMPSWLQQAPSRPARTPAPETVDLSSLTEGVEIPGWLSDLSRRVEAGGPPEQSPAERPLAEAIVEHAPEVGEPEEALSAFEPERAPAEAETSGDAATPVTVAEDDSTRVPPEPEPALRFQVRTTSRMVPEISSGDATGPTRQVPAPVVPRTPHRLEPPRSIGALILLVLLLIGLAAVGVWYYWL